MRMRMTAIRIRTKKEMEKNQPFKIKDHIQEDNFRKNDVVA